MTSSLESVTRLHPSVIHRFLLEKSAESCLQLLPLLSDEQFVRLFDYDVWQGDRLSPESAVRWLDLYRRIGPAQMVRRFQSLDEEYQLVIIAALIDLVTADELESLPVTLQDSFVPLPCRQLFYRVKSQQSETLEFVPAFVEAALSQDLGYTYTLLHQASYCLVSEQEQLLLQFRTARLEEDGFVSFSESLKIFAPIDVESYLQKWQLSDQQNCLSTSEGVADYLVDVIKHCQQTVSVDDLEDIQLKLLLCSNTLCSATMIEANDRRGIKKILEQTRAMIGFSLDFLSVGNIDLAGKILVHEYGQVLFRLAMTMIYRVQEKLLLSLAEQLPATEQLRRLHRLHKWSAIDDFIDLNYLDIIGYQHSEILKGLLGRFPEIIDQQLVQVNSRHNYRLFQQHCELLVAHLTENVQ